VLSGPVLRAVGFEATLILLTVLSIMLAGRDFARPEWDLEWLATLPLPLPTLLLSRLLERIVTSASGMVGLLPFLSVLAWTCGYRWTAPLLGLALTLALLFIAATVQLVADTGLRLWLSPPQLRNLHAAASVLSVPLPLLAMAMVTPLNPFIFDWAAAFPDWAMWLPPGLAVRALAAADGASALSWCGIMLVEILFFVTAGLLVLQRQLRDGVVAAGAREAVVRRPRKAPLREAPSRGVTLLSAVQRRELRLLARDRTFLVQTMVFPAVIVGMQFFFNAGVGLSLGLALFAEPLHLAATAFAFVAYGLMFSAFQALNAEGQALWILYSVPHRLEAILMQKARLWAAITMVYPLALFGAAVAVTGSLSLTLAAAALIVLAGVPIFSLVATALGVFAYDPLQPEIHGRIRTTYVYLYMLLTSLYVYAIYAAAVSTRAAIIILMALVAMALWQKARDRFDGLLDPSVSPPRRVSLADGLIAALLFFVLQGLFVGFQMGFARTDSPTLPMLWTAFWAAGAITYGLVRLIYWLAGTAGVPRLLAHDPEKWKPVFGQDHAQSKESEGVRQALLVGAIGGVIASLLALAYLQLAPISLAPPPATKLAEPGLAIGLAVVAVVAAPVFEEFIFRGLIFQGLRRSFGLAFATLASAAVFALVHPPYAMVPVFVMGALAAWVYDRTRMLAAPMTAHAIYNAAVIAWQWNAIYG
jgi:membrane protease YdiL (CAAX protease family)